jgi:hypothetical protein
VDSEENRRAEALVLRYRRDRFLDEHRRFGLVDFGELERRIAGLEADGACRLVRREEIDDLLSWVVGMTLYRVGPSRIRDEASFLEDRFHPRRIALHIRVVAAP